MERQVETFVTARFLAMDAQKLEKWHSMPLTATHPKNNGDRHANSYFGFQEGLDWHLLAALADGWL
jgi:hypothetical protein